MGEERIAAAIIRLESAIARVEAASAGSAGNGRIAEDAPGSLLTRHQALRGKVEGAIAKIDALIEAERH